jgi:tetratricopeptide (TPR) repeat protein
MGNTLEEAAKLYKNGDKQQATKLLSSLVRQEPNNSSAWYGLALCLDEVDKKVYCLEKVLEINPNHAKASKALDRIANLNPDPTPFKDDSKKCSYCAEKIKQDAKFCRYCGRDLIRQQKEKKGTGWLLAGIFVVIIFVLLCGSLYSFYADYQATLCGEAELDQALVELDNILYRWSIQNKLAEDSNRFEIVTPNARLKEIRNETASMYVPYCLEDVHEKLLNYMDSEIDWNTAFMLADFDYLDSHLHDSDIALDKLEEAMRNVSQCEPKCP